MREGRNRTEIQKVVYEVLQQSAFAMQLKDLYGAVKAKAPHLCDDSILPCPYCKQQHPLWQHQSAWALQSLKVRRLVSSPKRGYWEVTNKRVVERSVHLSGTVRQSLHKGIFDLMEVKEMVDETIELNEIEFDQSTEDEAIASDLPFQSRKIYTDKADPQVTALHSNSKKGKLVLQPDFQRYFVWDTVKSSRLIESAFLDIPLPIIYLSEENDNKTYVIDGQQRLTAFFSFIDGKFPDGKDFKLTGLKVIKELNGQTFKTLDETWQDKIVSYALHTITFKRESEVNLKFEIFERLNTGAVSLNDQELRNCIYRGPYNRLLKELSGDSDFMHLLGLKKADSRMKDIELVLRFAAFHHATYLNYKPPIKSFLNKDMQEHQQISPEKTAELRTAFKNAVMIIRSLLDTRAFKRFYKGNEKNTNGNWEPKKFNTSLYDILMYSFAREDKSKVYQNLDSVREALIYLMTDDQDFIRAIEISTSSPEAVTTRFDKWRLTLQSIIGIAQKEPRCFSMQLKKELFDINKTCSICGNEIKSIDDSAVDHIEQYWMGGKTIPKNARLTHRYCNWARPKKEGG